MRIKKIFRHSIVFILSVTLVFLLTCTLACVCLWLFANGVERDVDEMLLSNGVGDRTTRLYCFDENGDAVEMAQDRISGTENTLYVPLDEISPYLIDAFISIEDKRFFEHGGIDWRRTASALFYYIKGEGGQFGGSTITQQLVKNLTGDNERSIRRKLSELMRAAKLEKMLSKEEILEKYLNVVNLAQGCYGVRTASNAYFSKEPSALTPEEAATIAAITNNPSRYDPIRNPRNNKERRDLILSQMYEQGKLPIGALAEALEAPVTLCVNREALSGRVNSWYADLVVSDVIRDLVKTRHMSESAASMLVYCGGLRIYTAMDATLQELVSAYYEREENFPIHEGGRRAQSGLLLLDPKTGDILAVAGAIGEKRSNRVQSFATDSKRPSGSVIKPLSVYAPALERGLITGASVFDDVPLRFKENGAPWPHNSPNIYRGLTTVREAVSFSVNTVCVSVLERLGAKNSYRFLSEELGFSSLDERQDLGAAALALGQQHTGVSLREIVGGYTALAGDGVYHDTRSYYRVLDRNGEILLENTPTQRRVLCEENAAILTMMLRDAVEEGTGRALTLKQKISVAGKTGTTGKNCDKWFVGYTPELLCGVWYGFEYPTPLNDVKGNPALRVFDAVMTSIEEVRPAKTRQFKTPENVVAVRYCRDSGLLPCASCMLDPRGERTAVGYFKRGTEPQAACDRHVQVSYCDHGGVAARECPEECRHTVSLLLVKREFPRHITVQDAPYTYWCDPQIIQRNLISNEPYYAIMFDSKRFFGIATDTQPFNRSCPGHVADDFWERRAQVG